MLDVLYPVKDTWEGNLPVHVICGPEAEGDGGGGVFVFF